MSRARRYTCTSPRECNASHWSLRRWRDLLPKSLDNWGFDVALAAVAGRSRRELSICLSSWRRQSWRSWPLSSWRCSRGSGVLYGPPLVTLWICWKVMKSFAKKKKIRCHWFGHLSNYFSKVPHCIIFIVYIMDFIQDSCGAALEMWEKMMLWHHKVLGLVSLMDTLSGKENTHVNAGENPVTGHVAASLHGDCERRRYILTAVAPQVAGSRWLGWIPHLSGVAPSDEIGVALHVTTTFVIKSVNL